MRNFYLMQNAHTHAETGRGFTIDTTFVLFFLAIEFGQSLTAFAMDSIFLAVTLAMLLVMPYFLITPDERPGFKKWLLGRSLIAAFAVLLGIMFRQSVGVLVPEAFKFLPMTMLIATAMISCYIQFYGFTKFRLAK